ncbi:hypothetical protein BGZ96_009432 [Linnemannia gamsii]|uniref:Cyclin-dependent kinases regulatory subunit n=1 Tax=Linnemannia gamsii TaxID=64522 RepID=A0ABQ7JY68_9FUNG|nr:hypothetical protein BGZ96_009432 [Linnemannia gamsii]
MLSSNAGVGHGGDPTLNHHAHQQQHNGGAANNAHMQPHDDVWEYRHVSLPKPIARHVPNELMTEEEWRSLGVKQSQGWEHYMIHTPEPHVLLFKREKDYQIKYLNAPPPK